MPIGVILLFVASVLVFFGLAQRVLDHLRLSDLGAVLFLVAMIAGSFINIPILRGRVLFSLNVGGGILPIALGLYILLKAGSKMEWGRALAGTVITGGIIWGITHIVSFEPGHTFLDPMLIFGIVAGIVGYVAGRSRRGSFVAATWGLLLTDIGNLAYLLATGQSGRVIIGGAGVFDNIVLAGLLAVIIAELVGETREHMAGGPQRGPGRPGGLHDPDMEMSWEQETGRVEFAQEEPIDQDVPLENREDLFNVLFTAEQAEAEHKQEQEFSANVAESNAVENNDEFGDAETEVINSPEGYPSQKGEQEIIRELYGEVTREENHHDGFQETEASEACQDNEEDLLGAILELAGDEAEAASAKRSISLAGGVELSFEEEREDEA